MSQRRGRLADFDYETAIEEVQDWYHIPTLVVLMGFMLWVRTQTWERFVRDGQVLFSGNDAWYHLRQTTYTVQNWPATMPFDPWTYFPYGTSSSQFGTLFDQLVATAALIVGLGSPSDQTIAITLLFAPAVFGTLVAVPVYLGGKQLGGRFGGVVAVLVLALSTGGFLSRSLVGFSDHHIAEVFFHMFAVVGFMAALSVAEDEFPVWELVANREWGALRRPVGWSALAGVALALYLWLWPPGVFLIGILGVFFVLHLTVEHVRGASPEPTAFVGVVEFSVAGVLALLPLNSFTFTATDFSLLQPFLAFAVAGGCAFMAWLARTFDDRGVDRRTYPLAVFGTIAVGTGLLALLAPDVFNYLVNNTRRVVGLGGGARAGTVGEAQPLRRPIDTLFASYGLAFVSAAVGAVASLGFYLRRGDTGAKALLVVVWAVMLLLATLTQQRFEYYLVLPVALLTGYLVTLVIASISTGEGFGEIQTFQVLTILTVLLVIVAPMAVGTSQVPTAVDRGGSNAPSSGVVGWGSGLEWMEENTPAPGTYGGDGDEMAYYGTYERTDDYDYDAGGYGVVSWWDYGHWITTRGQRIPTANPFQQGAGEAANFLLAPNETQAEDVMGRMSEDNAEPQYVVVDWKMVSTWSRANGKFFAPTVFYEDADVSTSDFYRRVLEIQGRQAQVGYYLKSQRYYDSMVNRLWHFHGSAQEPRPVVVDYETRTAGGQTYLTTPGGDQPRYRVFGERGQSQEQALEEARNYTEQDGTAQVGGVGPNPPEYVEALEHYRLVHNSQTSAFDNRSPYGYTFQSTLRTLTANAENPQRAQREAQSLLLPNGTAPPWIKVFERVPGATIEGTGPPNATVRATVQMRAPSNNETFFYQQQAETGPDGEFTMTLPYSTTGYDNWAPENGHTNVSVRATGPYEFRTEPTVNESGHVIQHVGSANVSEAQVIGEDNSSAQVNLERQVVSESITVGSGGDEGGIESGSSDGSADGSSDPSGQSSLAGPTRTGTGATP